MYWNRLNEFWDDFERAEKSQDQTAIDAARLKATESGLRPNVVEAIHEAVKASIFPRATEEEAYSMAYREAVTGVIPEGKTQNDMFKMIDAWNWHMPEEVRANIRMRVEKELRQSA